jgi:hypothetical protein
LIFKLVLSAVMVLTLWGTQAVAQQVTAEVRTWDGRSVTLSEPSFEVFYTILPSVTAALGGGGGYAGGVPPGPGLSPVGVPGVGVLPPPRGDLNQGPTNIGIGSVGFQSGTAMLAASGTLLPEGPASKQGRRQQETVRLSRQGVEVHIPVANLATLAFTRTVVARSGLPPYVAAAHFRRGATATMADGTQVDGDYVNLGTGVLRGTTPQGTVDIPWEEIEMIRFRR